MCAFNCLGKDCPNHCCGAYDGITSVLRPLGQVTMSEIILLPQDVRRLIDAGYAQLVREGEDGIARIDTAPDGTCAALVDGRCSVYEYRPAICRAYPLYIDMYSGVCALTECPAVPPDMRPEDYPEAMEALLDIYQYWIGRYRKLP